MSIWFLLAIVDRLNQNIYAALKTLWDAVGGIGASHDAEHQFHRGGCMEGTREAVLAVIFAWITSGKRSLPICWLSGAAGVGKSAIAITVARAFAGKGLVSSFFFFRSDPKRNNPSALMLTISHGLLMNMPFVKSFINQRISDRPTILEAQMEDQFHELVVKPSLRWKWCRELLATLSGESSSSKDPRLIIIDGLDECGDEDTQRRILLTIRSAYEGTHRSPLRFLICSRPEAWIQEAFQEEALSRMVESVVLDDRFMPNMDIERYYLHEFKTIRADPKYKHFPFPTPWPSAKDLQCLVQKSSGQFVYAATTIRFITILPYSPIDQLQVIIDYAPEDDTPKPSLARLDDLYWCILSLSPNRDRLPSILAAILILPSHAPPSLEFIGLLLPLTAGEIDLTLRFLHSVLNIENNGEISVYHTSFPDFLYDASRSKAFHVDRAAHHHNLALRWYELLTQMVQGNPKIVLDPTSAGLTTALRHLLRGWVTFFPADKQSTTDLRVDLLHSILSTLYLDRQRLLVTLASIILLPPPQSDLTQFQAFNDLILGPNEVHTVSTMKLLENCELATRSPAGKTELVPFFLAMLCASTSQEYYIDIPKQRCILAQRWIRALVPSNQPTSK